MNNIVRIYLSNQITLRKDDIPFHILTGIKNYLTLDNPKYLEAKKRDYYTGNIEPKIYCYREDSQHIYIYRGYMGNLLSFLCQNGMKYKLIDERRTLPEIDFHFYGDLREYQLKAVNDALQKHFSVLVSPCGSGKTVMALSIVAQRRQPTLIICHTKELLNQWIDRINQYSGIPKKEIGIVGNGKESIKAVSVGMVQTLAKRNLAGIREHFGQIIIDECHHTPASTFINVVSAFDCKYMLGLSATPYRRDKLNKLIYTTVGNVVAEVKSCDIQDNLIVPEIITRETSFQYDYKKDSDYVPMITALIEDSDRNEFIISDVVYESQDENNYSLILSDRKAHCEELAFILEGQGIECAVLTGDLPPKKRETIIQDLESGSLKVIFATGQLAGEGLDLPKLNRLFVTTPIRWKGRIKQYAGRVMRPAEGKNDAKIYDYVDSVGVLINSYKSRYYQVYNHLN